MVEEEDIRGTPNAIFTQTDQRQSAETRPPIGLPAWRAGVYDAAGAMQPAVSMSEAQPRGFSAVTSA